MDQKLENLLNLALETNEAERARTGDLNVGYDEAARSWELIVKYSGDLNALKALGISVEYLIAGYAVLTVPENLVEAVSKLEQIEYVEKPKRYYYSEDMGGNDQPLSSVAMSLSGADLPEGEGLSDTEMSEGGKRTGAWFPEGLSPVETGCLADVMFAPPNLSGEGTLIAVLDSGIDWRRREFRRADGSTRILYFWDQTLKGEEPPDGFAIGGEFDAAQINEALQAGEERAQAVRLPGLDVSGHGTAVAGIAAGALQGAGYLGAAPRAELLIVKLGVPDAMGFPRTTEIMRGVTWALRKAEELKRPLVINLSFGNCYGAHDGSSLLERFLDNASETGRTVICVGSGNEGAGGGHAAGNLNGAANAIAGAGSILRGTEPGDFGGSAGRNGALVELAVAEYERSLRIQFWQDYSDVYRIFLRSPGGRESELTASVNGGKFTLTLEGTKILAYQGEPAPYAVAKELYLELLPVSGAYIDSGVWGIRIEPVRVVTGQYSFYLSDSASRSGRTRFYNPTPQSTLTVPSTAAKVITVGAYDPTYDAYADFSGRGYADRGGMAGVVASGLRKPDLVAAGVNVLAPDIYGGYMAVTGTSFATPIVAGAAALLMEWGIVRGNDPFLYGEKVKAYLRKGAQPLRGETVYPNDRTGWGKLCVERSLPG